MVGNDVVDLDDPAIEGHHLRARFVERVLCDDERDALSASASPKVLLWSLFAAKEAAYKIVARRGAPPPFAHRRFVVARDLQAVRYDGEVFGLDVEVSGGAVHAIATGDGARATPGLDRTGCGHDLGVAARALLCRAVAPTLGCAVSELAVVRAPRPGSWDGFGPPELVRAGRRLAIDVSLSHDGRFVAFAFAPRDLSVG